MFYVIERKAKLNHLLLASFDDIEDARLDMQARNDACYRTRTPKCIYIQYPKARV